MKIYTDVQINRNMSYVGYTLVGEHNQEYATNVQVLKTIDASKAHVFGIMSAVQWVKANKPLHCDISNITHYHKFQSCENFNELLMANEYLKRLGSTVKYESIKHEDTARLQRLSREVDYKIHSDNIFGHVVCRDR